MSGSALYPKLSSPELMSKAEKAGMPAEQLNDFYNLVGKIAKGHILPYDEIEDKLLQMWSRSQHEKVVEEMRANFNKINDAIKAQASMREADNGREGSGRYVHRRHQVNKSSKGKYPSNYTPPKKKRK